MSEERTGRGLEPARTAGLLFKFHGRRALKIAANRATMLAEDGDRDGAIEWLRISEAVRDLLKRETKQ
ncbi:MAG: hypothetical protein OJJ21_16980 [Ferrovibrio sp.]|uniref:hypothetical protein n=1 Tax=Ferrovibrio sp. TaxID=1917215 RepID=UPI00261BD6F8|nr:hypothetical protein [Ferrovibrio sp.]MCW0235296.1 hypothetical protein [Ferrovibrio sp.]